MSVAPYDTRVQQFLDDVSAAECHLGRLVPHTRHVPRPAVVATLKEEGEPLSVADFIFKSRDGMVANATEWLRQQRPEKIMEVLRDLANK